MFKKGVGVLLSVIIITQSMVNVGIYAYYHINKKMIAEKLCINKNNPQMHCNGHCYLTKQLRKAEDAEQKQSQSILKEKDEIFSERITRLPEFYFPDYKVTKLPVVKSSTVIAGFTQASFRPPIA
jgi:hypothetical protein